MMEEASVVDLLDSASTLIALNLAGRGVAALPDLAPFKNLTELDLSNNCLLSHQRTLHSLKFLKRLFLRQNQLQALWPLPNTLEVLDLASNCLQALTGLEQLPRLQSLNIAHNQVSSLAFLQTVPGLKYLYAAHNQVTALAGLDTASLVEVDLSHNKLETLSSLQVLARAKTVLVLQLTGNPVFE